MKQTGVMVSLLALAFLCTGEAHAKTYKGAELRTKESYKWGRFEVRMMSSGREGMLSSFFTYNDLNGIWNEIDIEILGRYPDDIQFNTITPGRFNHLGHYKAPFSPHQDYHTYAIEWTPQYVSWFVDGREVLKQIGTHISTLVQPQKIMMNVWIPNFENWVGTWNDLVLPAFAYYDFVSYASYTPSSGSTGTGNNFTLQWKDEFDSLDVARWDLATHTWAENKADMLPANIAFRDGKMILCLTKETATGYADNVPPSPVSARWSDGSLTVRFTEEVDSISATAAGSYIVPGVTLSSHELLFDHASVRMSAPNFDTSKSNTAIVQGIKDRFSPSNTMTGKSLAVLEAVPLTLPVRINVGGPAWGEYLEGKMWGDSVEHGAMDGFFTVFNHSLPIAGTNDQEVYRTQMTGLVRYRVRVRDGRYNVMLMFAENQATSGGQRVFHAKVQNTEVSRNVDVLARAGANTAYTLTADSVEVTEGVLEVHLMSVVGETMLSGLVIEPADVNSAGPAESGVPIRLELSQNYPNPFNPATIIRFHLPGGAGVGASTGSVRSSGSMSQTEPGHVSLKVYDMLGREVATLVNEALDPGAHSVEFNADGLSTRGRALSSGTYLYRLRAGGFVETRTMLLLR
jgi:hypothetical protein